jgi:hypothetical protein
MQHWRGARRVDRVSRRVAHWLGPGELTYGDAGTLAGLNSSAHALGVSIGIHTAVANDGCVPDGDTDVNRSDPNAGAKDTHRHGDTADLVGRRAHLSD